AREAIDGKFVELAQLVVMDAVELELGQGRALGAPLAEEVFPAVGSAAVDPGIPAEGHLADRLGGIDEEAGVGGGDIAGLVARVRAAEGALQAAPEAAE